MVGAALVAVDTQYASPGVCNTAQYGVCSRIATPARCGVTWGMWVWHASRGTPCLRVTLTHTKGVWVHHPPEDLGGVLPPPPLLTRSPKHSAWVCTPQMPPPTPRRGCQLATWHCNSKSQGRGQQQGAWLISMLGPQRREGWCQPPSARPAAACRRCAGSWALQTSRKQTQQHPST